jgi:hypothetical protein
MSRRLPAVGIIRNLGPTSWQVADVASGREDVFWEFGRDSANLLAGSLIADEAGAIISDARGNPWSATSDSFVAAAPGRHPQVINVLADVAARPPDGSPPRRKSAAWSPFRVTSSDPNTSSTAASSRTSNARQPRKECR